MPFPQNIASRPVPGKGSVCQIEIHVRVGVRFVAFIMRTMLEESVFIVASMARRELLR